MKNCRDCGKAFEPAKESIAVCKVCTLLIRSKISEDNGSHFKVRSMYGQKYRGVEARESVYETKRGVDR